MANAEMPSHRSDSISVHLQAAGPRPSQVIHPLVGTSKQKFFNFLGASTDSSKTGTSELGGILSGLSGLFGFANGGSFNVGGGGGTDSQLVAFMATPGEKVSVTNPGQGAANGINLVYNIDARGATTDLVQALPGRI